MKNRIDRRAFILNAAAVGGATLFGECACPFGGMGERVPYGDTIGDRLWMWGHHRDAFKSLLWRKLSFNLPYDTRIDQADACRDMGIPGCFVVRWCNLPAKVHLFEYMKQFKDTKRVGFSIVDNAIESFEEKVRLGFELADQMPNLTTFVMDDFWDIAKGVGLRRIEEIHEELNRRGMKLDIVQYSDQEGVRPEHKKVLDFCDEITFWFWHGFNVGTIEDQVGVLRDLMGPDKPVLLGQYMWDFGEACPMTGRSMEIQLEATTRLLAQQAIHGVIFHCTPLVDMDLDAVRVSREWVKEYAPMRWGI